MKLKQIALLACGIFISFGAYSVLAQEVTTTSLEQTSSNICTIPNGYQSISQNLWTKNSQENGTLTFGASGDATLTCNSGSTRCVVRTAPSEEILGDFRLSIDIDSYSAIYNQGDSFVFIMNLTSDKVPYAYRVSAHQNEKGTYITYNPTLNSKGYVAEPIEALASLNNLTLIVERKGSIISGYYSQGGEEVLVSSINAFPAEAGLYPTFVISNSPGSDPATTFDNLQVKISNFKTNCLVNETATSNNTQTDDSDSATTNTSNQEAQTLINNNKTLSNIMVLVIVVAIVVTVISVGLVIFSFGKKQKPEENTIPTLK